MRRDRSPSPSKGREPGPRTITIHTHQSRPGHVAIEVSDTGVGAHREALESIFEKFVTSKPNGLGMGLAISRSIITAHGGRIWATRNVDRGLTMHIELAAYDEVAARGGKSHSLRSA